MLPPAVTVRLPPPIVLTVGLSVLVLVRYHVVGSDTARFVMFPPADTETLPPTLITPWSNAPKLIDVCTVCVVGVVCPTRPGRLPVCNPLPPELAQGAADAGGILNAVDVVSSMDRDVARRVGVHGVGHQKVWTRDNAAVCPNRCSNGRRTCSVDHAGRGRIEKADIVCRRDIDRPGACPDHRRHIE